MWSGQRIKPSHVSVVPRTEETYLPQLYIQYKGSAGQGLKAAASGRAGAQRQTRARAHLEEAASVSGGDRGRCPTAQHMVIRASES